MVLGTVMVLGTGCLIQLAVQLAMLVCIIFAIWNAGQNLQPWRSALGQPRVGVISIINICRHIQVCWFPWVAG